MDRGAWRAIVHGVAKSQTQLSTRACMHACKMKEKAFFLFFFFFLFSFWLIQVACGISVPQSVIDPHPLQWKLKVQWTTREFPRILINARKRWKTKLGEIDRCYA